MSIEQIIQETKVKMANSSLVTNGARAKWAEEGVIAYATACVVQPFQVIKTNPGDVISDLLVDLRHYCDMRGLDFALLNANAGHNYEWEKASEAHDE